MNTRTKRLWAPWRAGYLAGARKPPSDDCLFCSVAASRADDAHHVICRSELSLSLLNKYPYNNGHLMVAPYRHVGRIEALTAEEWADLFLLLKDATARLESVLSPHGYNVGINVGRPAGAGIPGHLHLHVVPRWIGDTNFMPVVNGTKVVSQALDEAHRQLKNAKKRTRHARRA